MSPAYPDKNLLMQRQQFRNDADRLTRPFDGNDLGIACLLRITNALQARLPTMVSWREVHASVSAVIAERVPYAQKMPGSGSELLNAVVEETVAQAAALGFDPEFQGWIRLAAYCSAAISGPAGYDMPDDTPAGIECGLPQVVSMADARRQMR